MSDGGRAVLSHSLHGLAATGIPSRCRSVLARVRSAGDVPVGDRRTVDRQTKDKRSFRPWNQRGRFHSPRPILAIEGAFPIPSQGPEPDILFRLVGLPVPVVAPAAPILSATTLSGASPSQPSPMSVDRRRHTHGYKLGSSAGRTACRIRGNQSHPASGARTGTERNSLHPESAVEIRGACFLAMASDYTPNGAGV